ncbi:MAG: hypothetical protein ACRENO_05305 [Thermodesulfobacteriota bacterium]
MKYLSKVIITSLFLGSCDPRSSKDLYLSGNFIFPVEVVNPRDSINLGDSVCFIFQIPDTINLNGNNKIKPFYGSNDGATFPTQKLEVDTIFNGGANPGSTYIKDYAEPGFVQGGVNLKVVNSNKLYTKYYLIPQRKGIFFLELAQAGYVDANNGGLKARAVYTLNVPNRNHNLLISSTLPRHNMAAYIQGRQNLGLEIYAFAVK